MHRHLCGALILLAACHDPSSQPSEGGRAGTVLVIVSPRVTGLQDPDGFQVTVGDSAYEVPSAGDTLRFEHRPAGERFSAVISGLAAFCWVAQATRSVTVLPDTTVDLRFVVNCSSPVGFVAVVTAGTGVGTRTGSLPLLFNGLPQAIGPTDTIYFGGTPGDPLDLQLRDGTSCWSPDTTLHHAVYPATGEITTIGFAPACGVLAATLRVPTGRWPFVLLNLDGRTRPLPLLDDTPGEVHWSPDGEQLLITGTDLRLTRLDLRTGNRTVYTDGNSILTVGASWSPDGDLAIVGAIKGTDYSYLYDLNLTTGNLSRLPGSLPNEYEPSISPNGAELAFIGIVDGHPLLEISDLAGNLKRTVADSASGSPPVWTPDGDTLIFVRDVPGGPPDPAYHARIWKVARDGSGLTRLTNAVWPEVDGPPAISPDGSTLVFTRYNVTTSDAKMMRMPIAGGPLTEVTTPAGQPFHATGFRP